MPEPKLPSCCALVSDDSGSGVMIDFWTAMPSGDEFADYASGDAHAEDVIRYARDTDQPEFVDYVIMWMTLLLYERYGTIDPSRPLERGFLDRVRRDSPAVIERLISRFLARNPQMLN